ncbi:hypothetical protein ACFY6U_18245 [Streptomyces sp. NPDC013157]|uniref:hypothetical protein n=1 Tax=Streptomyces sp. NPDC013157 TaxID=3364861 RepID=UPI0036B702AE
MQDAVMRAQRPAVLETLREGGTVPFGVLSLSRAAVSARGQGSLPWPQVREVQAAGGLVRIMTTDASGPPSAGPTTWPRTSPTCTCSWRSPAACTRSPPPDAPVAEACWWEVGEGVPAEPLARWCRGTAGANGQTVGRWATRPSARGSAAREGMSSLR